MQKSLVEKRYICPNYRVILPDASGNYRSLPGELWEDVSTDTHLSGIGDFIQIFLTTRSDLEVQLSGLKNHLAENGLIWITYPKTSSKIKDDIKGDNFVLFPRSRDLKSVAMVAVDENWSALREKVI